MHRVVAAGVSLFLFLTGAPPAQASDAGYELKVTGMVCAFCAYSVSRQLRTVDGVAPDSIDVDLASGTITLRSDRPLDRAILAERVEAAGFALDGVTETAPEPSPAPPGPERAAEVRLTLDAGGLAEGEFDAVLEALGRIASERSAPLAVTAPAGLELRLLRPVLMGRTPAMDVDFSEGARPDNTVLIELLAR